MSFLLLLPLWGCNKSGVMVTNQVVFLTSLGGVGDHGYNDLILTGFEREYAKLPNNVIMMLYTPKDMSQVEETVRTFCNYGAEIAEKTIIVLAGSDYRDFLIQFISNEGCIDPSVEFLLFESPQLSELSDDIKAYSFTIDMYKSCYEAGVFAAQSGFQSPLVWLANPSDNVLIRAGLGFSDGYFSVSGQYPDKEYLSSDMSGYSMSAQAYEKMSGFDDKYDFIFPVMGGSSMGIFRYLREHPEGPAVVGMDVDQSIYSTNVVGNILKSIDRIVEIYIDRWINGYKLDKFMEYGAESGFIEWSVTDTCQYGNSLLL